MAAADCAAAGRPWEARLQWASSMIARCDPLKRAADRIGCSPWALAMASCLWIVGFLFWGFTGELVCFLAGLLYPMWASFRALEDAHEDASSRAPEEWLVYWVTGSALTLLECVFYRFLAWMPFYYPMRLLFIIWLFNPSWQGAALVYRWAVAPVLRLHRPTVDAVLAQAATQVHEAICGELHEGLCEGLRSAAANGAGYVQAGIEELVTQELKKAAASHIGKITGEGAADQGKPHLSSARTRAATPPPRRGPDPDEH